MEPEHTGTKTTHRSNKQLWSFSVLYKEYPRVPRVFILYSLNYLRILANGVNDIPDKVCGRTVVAENGIWNVKNKLIKKKKKDKT